MGGNRSEKRSIQNNFKRKKGIQIQKHPFIFAKEYYSVKTFIIYKLASLRD
jgi:hypothetical protein